MDRVWVLTALLTGALAAFALSASLRIPMEEWELKAIEIRKAISDAGLGVAPEDHKLRIRGFLHLEGHDEPRYNCMDCHGPDEPDNQHSCTWCHSQFWGGPMPADHDLDIEGIPHAAGGEDALTNCSTCHGPSLRGGIGGSCRDCHHVPVWRTK